MGAFDGELAVLGIGYRRRSSQRDQGPRKEPTTFYVSWSGGSVKCPYPRGSTGQHFDTKHDAWFFAQGMAGPLMDTGCWFDTSEYKK